MFAQICNGTRPDLDEAFPLYDLIKQCWDTVPDKRPLFNDIIATLKDNIM